MEEGDHEPGNVVASRIKEQSWDDSQQENGDLTVPHLQGTEFSQTIQMSKEMNFLALSLILWVSYFMEGCFNLVHLANTYSALKV